MCVNLVTNYKKNLTSVLANKGYSYQVLSHVLLGVQILIFCIKCKLSHKCYKMQVFWIFLLIFCFSLLKYTYYYNYRSHKYLCKWPNLRNRQGLKYLFSPLYIQYIFYIHTYTYTHATRIHTHMLHIYIYTHIHTHMLHIYIYTHMHTYTHAKYIHIHTYTYIHTC